MINPNQPQPPGQVQYKRVFNELIGLLVIIVVSFRLFLSLNSEEHLTTPTPPETQDGGIPLNSHDVTPVHDVTSIGAIPSASFFLRSTADAVGYNSLHYLSVSELMKTSGSSREERLFKKSLISYVYLAKFRK